jgi:tRNA-specific 2-thiouridylase
MSKGLVVVAMSGGVDSSIAAALLLEAGYEVTGITLKLKDCDDTRERTKACCGLDDYIHVRLAADKLGIPHYFLDCRDDFKQKVLEYAWDEYRQGRTPNPCCMCNRYIKFGILADYARSLGAVALATGHYAKLKNAADGAVELRCAADNTKNQTYFLSMVARDQLAYCMMPLGEYTKVEVRAKAALLGLDNANKAESQDACFGYRGEAFADTLARHFNFSPRNGEIVNTDGKVIGHHGGIHRYTIGQRQHLGVALGKPAYVSQIEPEQNRITLTTDQNDIMVTAFHVKNINVIADFADDIICLVQARYGQKPVQCRLLRSGSTATVTLEAPMIRPAVGQIAAFYRDDMLLAGSIICTP